jgi:uncharacterized protein (DUF849 family)
MSPHLPVSPQEIADAAVQACEAGAAIIHLHARDPETGKPDQTPEGLHASFQTSSAAATPHNRWLSLHAGAGAHSAGHGS